VYRSFSWTVTDRANVWRRDLTLTDRPCRAGDARFQAAEPEAVEEAVHIGDVSRPGSRRVVQVKTLGSGSSMAEGSARTRMLRA
jgi:hypothetical protein